MGRYVRSLSSRILSSIPAVDEQKVEVLLEQELKKLGRKIVVLDDDPTGVQTVHGVSVYTDWSQETLERGFAEENSIFFILTNSRGFTVAQTMKAHQEIARNIVRAAEKAGQKFILISRGDSTLRGHYPLETEVLRKEIEALGGEAYDGEIIYPFFKEGGRFTMGNIHYVKAMDQLIPAGLTEFARDTSFGYQSSDLTDWCEEKSGGAFKAEEVTAISLEELRQFKLEEIEHKLKAVEGFGKVIVNSVDYVDVKIFMIAFCRAVQQGKNFLFRSAAAVTKVLGGIADKPLLTKAELMDSGCENGGIVLVGSHVKKTTEQLEELRKCRYPLRFFEFNAHLVKEPNGLEREVGRVIALAEEEIRRGISVVIYTSRKTFDLGTTDRDQILTASVKISDAVTSIIGKLALKPSFIIAKGGITSSDVGTKALRVVKATVLGQIKPGVPVWLTGPESKFPQMPYVIFPGNVGESMTLRETVEVLLGE